jgi:hypothetical protein
MPAMSKTNYRDSHFPHPTLTPVVGYPTYATILQLQNETNENLFSVPSTLGGGINGHVGLGLSKTAYARGCSTPFDRPDAPGAFIPPSDTNELVQQRAERKHKELVEDFQAINLLERTCLSLIKKALDPKILIPKTDRFTGAVKGTIPEIFQYLYKSYGNITNFTLESKRQELLAYNYVHAEPLDVIFNAIDEYADMAEANGTSLSEDQLKGIATMILNKAVIYADAIEKWDKELFKSWKDFQTFFIAAQDTYKGARPNDTAASLGYTPQANFTADSNAASEALKAAEAYISELEAAHAANTPPVPPVAAAVTPGASPNDELLKKLLTQMEELQTKVAAKKNNKKTDKTSKERLYCWTHGSCAHNGKDCKHPKEGHKKEATFSNMMGGSTKECYWIKND